MIPDDQHTEVLGDEVPASLPEGFEPGPIALLPRERDIFRAAVERAGGVVSDLGPETRGLIWLSYAQADDLSRVLADNPQIGWVQLPWAGVDKFAEALRTHGGGRVFTSAKGAYAQPVAEHALAMILALLRAFPRRARLATWDDEVIGTSLYGLRVTVVGAGGIARELQRLMTPFGVRLTVVRRRSEPFPGAELTLTSNDLVKGLSDADVVVIAAALTERTHHLIGAPELAAMRPNGVLVNIARGPLVEPVALRKALEDGHLAGAALDVTDPEPLPEGDPLWTTPNILITPHQADTPDMTAPLLARRVETNVRAFLSGGAFVGVVDAVAGY